MKYNILITPALGQPYTIKLETDNIKWSMEQYARNRAAFTYQIIEDGSN